MSPDDEEFEVRVGRAPRERARPGFAAKIQALARRQGGPAVRGGGRFNRSGAGRAAATVLRLQPGGRRSARRVIVKARVVKRMRGAAPGVHLRYLQRDGTTRDGGRGVLYGASEDVAEARAFLDRGEGDPHQFRFIVSPEDGGDLQDLRAFTRDLMVQAERDLGVPLDWVAVDHFNTGHPHSHIVLRGRDLRGQPLFIAGDYIAHGLRGRASDLATLELGPRTAIEIERRRSAEVDQRRFTGLDRAILRDVAVGVDPSVGRSPAERALRIGRLSNLERMGLARRRPDAAGWALRGDAEAVLRGLEQRDEIIRSLYDAMAERGGVSPEQLQLHDGPPHGVVSGRLIGRRLSDDLGDDLAVILEGFDGRVHHLPLPGSAVEIERAPLGAIIAIGPTGPRPADREIAARAAASGGVYHPSQHLADRRRSGAADPEPLVEAHVRRLEALRRRGLAERLDADTWSVPPDFLERAADLEAGRGRRATFRVLSLLDLGAQVAADGATWLDRQLVSGARFSDETALGRDTNAALAVRADRLEADGEAWRGPDGRLSVRPGLLARLQAKELRAEGDRLATEVGAPFSAVEAGEAVDGTYRRRVQLVSGAFALVERAHDFVLVPWRPVIEPQLGGAVRGTALAGGGVDWRLGRDRGPGL